MEVEKKGKFTLDYVVSYTNVMNIFISPKNKERNENFKWL